MRGVIAVLGLMLVLEGCASSGTAASAPGSTQRTAARRTNVITAAELAENPQLLSVADAVRQLRPGWPQAQVYLDNDPFGPWQQLTQLTTRNAREIRYLTASEAQMKWGPRVQDIIQVVTR